MIPRYSPTYSLSDLYTSLRESYRGHKDVNAALAERIAQLYKVKHVFLVDSGRSALYLLLKAYGRPGGVILPAYTCIVVPEAIRHSGYDPILLDIDSKSLTISLDTIRKSISPSVTVFLATHLLGMPVNVDDIRGVLHGSGILLAEDAAPAVGAELGGKLVGTFGDASILSFQVTKVISGETGGALLTNRDDLAQGIRAFLDRETAYKPSGALSQFVRALFRKVVSQPFIYSIIHRSYRFLQKERMYEVVPPTADLPDSFLMPCSRFSSSLVLAQMDRLDWNVARRRKIASIYQNGTRNLSWLSVPPLAKGSAPAWLQYSVFVEDKWRFYKFMQSNGIDLSWTYRYSCAESFGLDGFPNTKMAASTVLGFPTYPSLTDEEAETICGVARKYRL